jgi:hypothetical protein
MNKGEMNNIYMEGTLKGPSLVIQGIAQHFVSTHNKHSNCILLEWCVARCGSKFQDHS